MLGEGKKRKVERLCRVRLESNNVEYRVRKTGQNRAGAALCATINVNPERSSERCSFVHSPRINPNSRLCGASFKPPPPPSPLSSPQQRYNSSWRRRLVSIVASRLASRFPNCLESWEAERFAYSNLGVWHARREGGGVQRDYSTAALCRWIASSRAQSSASWSGKKERGREKVSGEKKGPFLFLFTTKLTLVQFFLFFFFFF